MQQNNPRTWYPEVGHAHNRASAHVQPAQDDYTSILRSAEMLSHAGRLWESSVCLIYGTYKTIATRECAFPDVQILLLRFFHPFISSILSHIPLFRILYPFTSSTLAHVVPYCVYNTPATVNFSKWRLCNRLQIGKLSQLPRAVLCKPYKMFLATLLQYRPNLGSLSINQQILCCSSSSSNSSNSSSNSSNSSSNPSNRPSTSSNRSSNNWLHCKFPYIKSFKE
jgi:hypothetical protein